MVCNAARARPREAAHQVPRGPARTLRNSSAPGDAAGEIAAAGGSLSVRGALDQRRCAPNRATASRHIGLTSAYALAATVR